MTTNNNGRNSGNRATPKHCTSTVKGCIVMLALWGLLPVRLADWLIQRGGLRHE